MFARQHKQWLDGQMEQVNFLWAITVTKEKRKWVTQRQILFCHRFALEANSFTCCGVQIHFSRGFSYAVLILLQNEFSQISLTLTDRKKPVKDWWFPECFPFIIHCAQQPLFSSENICCHINPEPPPPPLLLPQDTCTSAKRIPDFLAPIQGEVSARVWSCVLCWSYVIFTCSIYSSISKSTLIL